MSFLERLLAEIDNAGITKNKLLTDLELSKNSFVAWSKRGTVPSGETLDKLANYFGVTIDYLLGRTDDPTPPDKQKPSAEAEGLTETQRRVYDMVKHLPDDKAAEAIDYVQYLIDKQADRSK